VTERMHHCDASLQTHLGVLRHHRQQAAARSGDAGRRPGEAAHRAVPPLLRPQAAAPRGRDREAQVVLQL
jgi:hypothetical protein